MHSNRRLLKDLGHALTSPAGVAFAWFGMTAPAASREAAVDIGRLTFALLNKAEFVALILTLLFVRISQRAQTLWWVGALLALILLAQSLWLLPVLTEHAQAVVSGTAARNGAAIAFHHGAYGVLELAKLALLLGLGFYTLARPAR